MILNVSLAKKFLVISLVGEILAEERNGKLLNVFNVIRFPNDACTTSANTNGVCYSASECRTRGGLSQGTCATGFGVCCAFIGRCGGSTSENNTYFASTGTDTSPCSFSVCKTTDDICQIRLNFDAFDIAQPDTKTLTSTNPSGRTQCQKAQFTASSAGAASPTICGNNQAMHMIVDASDSCNLLNFNWVNNASPNNWNIHIMQIPCTAKWKPPEGCLQYFTGSTGTIQSYNWAGGVHLANQDYNNCIRTERGFCSMQYTQVGTNFDMSTTTATTSAVGDTCTDDYVIIAGGDTALVNSATSKDRFCGSTLNSIAGQNAGAAVLTQRMPYMLGVFTNGAEVDAANAAEASKGFQIAYEQKAC